MAPLDLSALTFGDRVHHELRVVERDDRRTRGGDPFVVLTLGNRYGEIKTAPIWSDRIDWANGAVPGAVVQVIGDVRRYVDNGTTRRQLELTAPVRVIPVELVSVGEFVPSVDDDINVLWAKLDKLRGEIASAALRCVVGLFFDDDAFRLAFERSPGSTRGHHARLGGLLRHVVEVTVIARTIALALRSGGKSPANVDLVTAGALLHDVGKVEAYDVSTTGFENSVAGHLVGHVVLGALMLDRRFSLAGEVCTPEQLLEVEHLILSHHGTLEYGSPVRPLTLEAEIVHWADEASAKSSAMADTLVDPETFISGSAFSGRVWQLDGRRVWHKTHSWD